jgi:hypothetical protein
MCFSAQASFASGIIISSIGIAALNKVHKPAHKAFATIPLLFGVQQIAEGFLWVTLPVPHYIEFQKVSTYVFMILAFVVWPVLIPYSITKMEEDEARRRKLRIFFRIGIFLSAYYGSCLILCRVDPQVSCYHILYRNTFPQALSNPAFIVYMAVTLTPFFISGMKGSRVMGSMMFFGCLITAIFFREFMTSVWCFFAAILSSIVWWILREYEKEYTFANTQNLQMS